MLRRSGEAPAGLEAVAVADLPPGSTPPRKIEGEEPAIPEFLSSPQAPRWVRLQLVIDAQGRVVEPRVIAGRHDAMRWAALEAVRTWRFEPARRDGQPVAVFLDVELPPRVETPLAEIAPLAGAWGEVHALLLKQQWSEARNRALALVGRVTEEGGSGDPVRSGAAVAFLALADAGLGGSLGDCYWHVAQSVSGGALYHADLSAYGAAGALLEAGNPWLLDKKVFRAGAAPTGETVERPKKIPGGGVPEYSTRDRLARIQGTIIVDALIAEDGRVAQPWVVKGLTPRLDLKSLLTLCNWRFQPATLDGKPVSVYYQLSVSFRVD